MADPDFDELERARRDVERAERDLERALSLIEDGIGKLATEMAGSVAEAALAPEAIRDLPARMMEASNLHETIRSVQARLLEAYDVQGLLRSVAEQVGRGVALEMAPLRSSLAVLTEGLYEAYDVRIVELVRQVEDAAATRLAVSLPTVEVPEVAIIGEQRPTPPPVRKVVHVPVEQADSSPSARGSEHPALPVINTLISAFSAYLALLAFLLTLALAVLDHPQIFARVLELLLDTAEEILLLLQTTD